MLFYGVKGIGLRGQLCNLLVYWTFQTPTPLSWTGPEPCLDRLIQTLNCQVQTCYPAETVGFATQVMDLLDTHHAELDNV